MKIAIVGTPEEIAALVVAIQEQRAGKVKDSSQSPLVAKGTRVEGGYVI